MRKLLVILNAMVRAGTTWRVGNTNRMLTNKHCFSTQAQVQSSEMQFNFQCATCGGNNPGAGTKFLTSRSDPRPGASSNSP